MENKDTLNLRAFLWLGHLLTSQALQNWHYCWGSWVLPLFPALCSEDRKLSNLVAAKNSCLLMRLVNNLFLWASQVAQWVKNLPAMQETQETWVWSLGWEDPLEEGKAIHSSILAWRIPETEEHGGKQSIGSQRVGHDWSNWACTLFGVWCYSYAHT